MQWTGPLSQDEEVRVPIQRCDRTRTQRAGKASVRATGAAGARAPDLPGLTERTSLTKAAGDNLGADAKLIANGVRRAGYYIWRVGLR